MAAMLVAALTGAVPAPESPADGHGGSSRVSAVVREDTDTTAKSPDDHGTSQDGPAPAAPHRPDAGGGPESGGTGEDAGGGAGVFGTHDLYEPDPGAEEDSAPSSQHPPTTAATGEVSPVLPLGAGMTLIGLGLALIALRLRHL
ncbi:hypothetical protein [Streptomyces bathyalis]|uniref:hypothetical protein n=1 Tax=Streptomyces bathyalis TaxID=2710756 RepID=UPI001A9C8256